MSRKVHRWGGAKHRRGIPVRPIHWVSSNRPDIGPGEFACNCDVNTILCQPKAFELVDSAVDMQSNESSSSTVTRVVGSVNVAYEALQLVDTVPTFPSVIVRLALLAVEYVDDIGTFATPDLFSNSDDENASWMWRTQRQFGSGTDSSTWSPEVLSANGPRYFLNDIHTFQVDCHINRKLGKEGSLLLVAQRKYPFGTFVAVDESTVAVLVTWDLRTLMKAEGK